MTLWKGYHAVTMATLMFFLLTPGRTFPAGLQGLWQQRAGSIMSRLYADGGRGSGRGSGRSSSSSSNSGRGRGYGSSGSDAGGRGNKGGGRGSKPADDGVRLNKCLPSLSRRGADDAIAEGRVTVNGEPAVAGYKVQPKDMVRLDGRAQNWQGQAAAKKVAPAKILEERNFIYLKYWKGRGVTCTSDRMDKSNIIQAGRFDLFPQRIFTVGRLDKDSTGLILLTSDGRVNQALLSPATKKEKIYTVEFDKIPTESQIEKLRSGVLITTEAQHKTARPLTAKTKPCTVTSVGGAMSRKVEFVLMEGRNRQIRKMAEAVGLSVVNLHRTSFAGISLKGVSEGNWCELSEKEMEVVQHALEVVAVSSPGSGSIDYEDDVEE